LTFVCWDAQRVTSWGGDAEGSTCSPGEGRASGAARPLREDPTASPWWRRADPDFLARSFERGFRSGSLPTLGLEEELILVDADSLEPADEAERVLAGAPGDARFKLELRAAQLELVTPVCLTVADARRELAGARAELVERLEGRVRPLAVGTHPFSALPITISQQPRYVGIALECPWVVRRGLPSGLHVHIGLGGPVEALAVFNAARSYLPELAALGANSPFFEGRDTGLASSRLKLCEDLPRAGIPPAFASWRELAGFVAWGARGRLFRDLSYLWWDIRPRPDYGTLEFRVADSQTEVGSSAAIAAICQSLVVALQTRLRNGERLAVHPSHMINENRWRALRGGLDGELVDLDTGVPTSTRDRLARLLVELEPHAKELGCCEQLAHAWSLLADGGGADRQRVIAEERGVTGLVEWLADTTEVAAFGTLAPPGSPRPLGPDPTLLH
jgi:carboxylate-amine ligase